jgi:aspartyl/asparaginyl beta-hydroxylase (cupin superfamily)
MSKSSFIKAGKLQKKMQKIVFQAKKLLKMNFFAAEDINQSDTLVEANRNFKEQWL